MLGEADDLSASAFLTAHGVAQHRLGIVMVSGGQLILDSANLGDDGVARGCFLSCHSYSFDTRTTGDLLGIEERSNSHWAHREHF